jgi:hypothetical protein
MRRFQRARSLRIWVNSADDPDHCDFILPAVVSAATLPWRFRPAGGPATRHPRKLDEYFTADYAVVEIAGEVRSELRKNRFPRCGHGSERCRRLSPLD